MPIANSSEQMPSASAEPKEWDVFQMDIFVANSFGCIQCVSIFAHAGKPMPSVQPLITQNTAKRIVSDVQPNRKFISAESARPIAMKMRPLSLSAQKPFANRLIPYSTPCTVRITPRASLVITPSSSIPGCAIERFLRVT